MMDERKDFTEFVAEYLHANGIETVTCGSMPAEPDRVATVYATGLRNRRDDDGSRFQVIVRSERDCDTAIGEAMLVLELLEDFSGLLTIDSPYVHRIEVDSGVGNIGKDGNNRLSYSVNFRAFYC